MSNNKSRININYESNFKDLDRSKDRDIDTHRDRYNYRYRSRSKDRYNYRYRSRSKDRDIDTDRDRYNYRYRSRSIDRDIDTHRYERGYSHRDRYKYGDERKYESRSISRPRNINYNNNKPDYINNLIKFNKKELNLNNPLEASNYFVTIVKDALNDNNNHFDGKNLSMLFVGAKKYNIKYNN